MPKKYKGRWDNWGTTAEVNHIKTMGTHRESSFMGESHMSVLATLKGYRKGALARQDWQGIDREKVMEVLEQRIKSLEKKEAKEIK
jgi:hypothetical protein